MILLNNKFKSNKLYNIYMKKPPINAFKSFLKTYIKLFPKLL